jgi:hypothetical protein
MYEIGRTSTGGSSGVTGESGKTGDEETAARIAVVFRGFAALDTAGSAAADVVARAGTGDSLRCTMGSPSALPELFAAGKAEGALLAGDWATGLEAACA